MIQYLYYLQTVCASIITLSPSIILCNSLFLSLYICLGSFYDKCISKNGVVYERDNGESGCYYFYSREDSKEYDYDRSMNFCEGIEGANGTLPIIKGPKDDSNMLELLNGYVSDAI